MSAARHATRASALLLVLWALLLLSAAIFMWASRMQDSIALHGDANRAVEAKAMAHSGMTVALHPRVSRTTPLPEEIVAPGMSFRVRMVSEGAKLNINWLLRGEEPRKLAMLRQWLEQRGLDFEQREIFVDSLLDYVDEDDLHRLNGREIDDEYLPANRELQSVREIARVHGAGPLLSRPGWEDSLTIYSQGPVDITAADPEILRLLPGLGEPRIQQFVQYRRGKDGLDSTEDDNTFTNLADVQKFLGLTAAQFAELNNLISTRDPTLRITSTGQSGKVSRQLEVVVRKSGGKPRILLWKE